jgi:hypothetical protein
VNTVLLLLWWAWVVIGVLAMVGISWEANQSRLAARAAWSPQRRHQMPSGLPLVAQERYQETVQF